VAVRAVTTRQHSNPKDRKECNLLDDPAVLDADEADGRAVGLVTAQGLAVGLAVVALGGGVDDRGVDDRGRDEGRGGEGQEDGGEELHCSSLRISWLVVWLIGCMASWSAG